MAQKPDQIERDVEARRQELHARVRELRGRAQGDIDTMRDAVQERADMYAAKVDKVKEKALEQVDEHPYLSLAGGFGLGFALGIAAPNLKLDKPGSNSHAEDGTASEEKGLLGSLMGIATGQIMQEIRGKVQEQVSDLVHAAGSEKSSAAAPST